MLKIETENVYVIGDSDKEQIRLLSEEEKQIFVHFIDILKSYEDQKKVTIVYRGEKKESLKDKFKQKDYGTRDFYDYLFVLGEKAKSYFKQDIKTIENRTHLQSISDISDETFCYIFREFNGIFKKHQKSNLSPKKKINQFGENDTDFVSFFTKFSNIRHFLNTITEQKEEDKIIIRDYYLYFLHTCGLGDKSFFVSTTTEWDTAKFFALKTKDNASDLKSIIFYYFIPNPICKYAIGSDKLGVGYQLCSKLIPFLYEDALNRASRKISQPVID